MDANIAKTMASMRGAPTRGGRVDRRGMREEAEANRMAEVEREKKLVSVNEFITVSDQPNGNGNDLIYAVANDGTVWRMTAVYPYSWTQVATTP